MPGTDRTALTPNLLSFSAEVVASAKSCPRYVSLDVTVTFLGICRQCQAIASIRIMPAVTDRLIAQAGNHRVILQHLGSGLWRMRIAGAPHSADFQNVYSSPDEAKADAARLIEVKFRAWQIRVPEQLQWIEG